VRLQAVFEDVADLRSAVEGALAAGVGPERIEVRSPVPLEHGALPLPEPKSRVLLFALGGAVCGGLAAFGLAAGTALAYPLPTGGMEIVAGPPIGIVTYEGTALGLILATVLRVLWEGGLLGPGRRRRGPSELDHHVAAGRFLLCMNRLTEDQEAALREHLGGCRPVAVSPSA